MMSFRDLLEGARQEAQESELVRGFSAAKSPKASKAAQSSKSAQGNKGTKASKAQDSAPKKTQFQGSAASAKPARELAGSVRVKSSKPQSSGMGGLFGFGKSAAEKQSEKAARRERNELADLRWRAQNIILERMPEYRRHWRIWCFIVGAGFVIALGILILSFVENKGFSMESKASGLTMVGLVLAYALIIGSFVYSFWKIRPLRRRAEARAAALSPKKAAELIAEEKAQRYDREWKKSQAKAAKEDAKKRQK